MHMPKSKFHPLDDSKTYNIFLISLIVCQVLVGYLLFSIFFTSIDSVSSIISKSDFWLKFFSHNINNTSYVFIGISLALNLILLVTFFLLKVIKRFPPTITIVALGVNSFVCLGVRTTFYICDLYNIFFDFQLLNILPIMTIIVSSVFVVYDYIDYYRGTYHSVQASTMLPTEEAVKETIDIIAKRAKDVTSRIDREKITNLNSDNKNKEDLSAYRTNEGYFNNNALEIAADNMIENANKN